MNHHILVFTFLAQNAKTLYSHGTIAQKQQLLQFLLPNVVVYDKMLSYTVKQPYNDFVELNKKPQNGADVTNWCHSTSLLQTVDTLIMAAKELYNDYLLAAIVKEHNLAGDLFAV